VSQPRVVAVIVTWNRRDLLAESLSAVAGQTRPPDRVVVVDNASTDGTAELLADRFPMLEVVRSAQNLGGAGGFALGIRRALDVEPVDGDAVWLLDDDTVPRATALEGLVSARSAYPGATPAVVASKVVWTDGRDHPMNTPRSRPGVSRAERRRAEATGCLPIRSASFVSVLVDADAVRERGLPLADYFLWNDDFEFTTRMIRGRVGLWCPGSVAVHKTATFGAADAEPGARFYYEVRNKVWVFTRSRGLSPLEKVGYGGATVLRWVRTLAASRQRGPLLGGLRRGLADGLRSGPRPTDEVLDVATSPPGVEHG
jgi:rhamnopyranosyl-N-acetylglucosaminyl-diphospho-decaprenol beta-1,3/1,4-galactofuranosyltransferase